MKSIQIKQLSESATLPTRAHEHDSGLDLYASEDTLVTYTHASVIPTGIAVNIPPGYEGQIRPRSGKSSKTNLRVILGTVDSGYNGEIGVIADTLNKSSYLVNKGDKIAQLVIVPIVTPSLEIVDQFDTQSDRGSNGFGSTDYDDNSKALELGQLLKFARENKGMTMVELSKELNVSQPYLSSLENGKSGVPKPKTLKKYSTALSIPYDKLLIKAGYVDRHLVDTDEVHR